jgi:hypothetical protein
LKETICCYLVGLCERMTTCESELDSLKGILREALTRIGKYSENELDRTLGILNQDWYTSPEELRLALLDSRAWSDMKLPGRLKLELKTILECNSDELEAAASSDIPHVPHNESKDETEVSTSSVNVSEKKDKDNASIEEQGERERERERGADSGSTVLPLPQSNATTTTTTTTTTEWFKFFSYEHEAEYYYNGVTEESRWEPPEGWTAEHEIEAVRRGQEQEQGNSYEDQGEGQIYGLYHENTQFEVEPETAGNEINENKNDTTLYYDASPGTSTFASPVPQTARSDNLYSPSPLSAPGSGIGLVSGSPDFLFSSSVVADSINTTPHDAHPPPTAPIPIPMPSAPPHPHPHIFTGFYPHLYDPSAAPVIVPSVAATQVVNAVPVHIESDYDERRCADTWIDTRRDTSHTGRVHDVRGRQPSNIHNRSHSRPTFSRTLASLRARWRGNSRRSNTTDTQNGANSHSNNTLPYFSGSDDEEEVRENKNECSNVSEVSEIYLASLNDNGSPQQVRDAFYITQDTSCSSDDNDDGMANMAELALEDFDEMGATELGKQGQGQDEMLVDPNSVARLVEMGFDKESAVCALIETEGRLAHAAALLASVSQTGVGAAPTVPEQSTSASTNSRSTDHAKGKSRINRHGRR